MGSWPRTHRITHTHTHTHKVLRGLYTTSWPYQCNNDITSQFTYICDHSAPTLVFANYGGTKVLTVLQNMALQLYLIYACTTNIDCVVIIVVAGTWLVRWLSGTARTRLSLILCPRNTQDWRWFAYLAGELSSICLSSLIFNLSFLPSLPSCLLSLLWWL